MLAVVLILMSFRFCPFFVSSQYVDRAQQNVQRKNTINHVIGRAIGLCFHSVEANRGEQLLANFALIKLFGCALCALLVLYYYSQLLQIKYLHGTAVPYR